MVNETLPFIIRRSLTLDERVSNRPRAPTIKHSRL